MNVSHHGSGKGRRGLRCIIGKFDKIINAERKLDDIRQVNHGLSLENAVDDPNKTGGDHTRVGKEW